jgi:U6 snRNA-associated Sm-like protein LSm7
MSNAKAVTAKKESILELTKMIDAKVHVKCLGGREVVGVLKGYDELVNLVLDDADEYIRGESALKTLSLFCVCVLM